MRIGNRIFTFLVASVAICAQALAINAVRPRTHHKRFRHVSFHHIYYHPVFRPSHESLLIQNEEIDRLELPRIEDDEQLEELKASGDLVAIVPSESLRIAPELPANRRYCRPWTLDFLNDISAEYYKEFHQQLQVNSAVRTVKVQAKLRKHNRNAAPYEGDTASSHLAGITVDIQRRGMTRKQVQWVEQYMVPLKEMSLIEPEEERHQWVFHVMVSGRYEDWREAQMQEREPRETVPSAAELRTISEQQSSSAQGDGN